MRRNRNWLLCVWLAACLSLTCTGCGRKRSDQEIITDLISYYGCYESTADEKISQLLRELNQVDRQQGALWQEIMDYWKYANESMPVHTDQLPDDLPDDDSLALVVLGYALNPDGSMQDELLSRLQVALQCAAQYPNAYVVCTGGGTALGNPDATEGGTMGRWMLENGLDARRLIVEDKSLTTAQNAANTYEILLRDYPQVTSAVIISSSYHIAWGSLMFESVFLRAASEQNTPAVHVISNCACQIENPGFPSDGLLHWETGGMFQMLGNDELAAMYYYNYQNVEKPPL